MFRLVKITENHGRNGFPIGQSDQVGSGGVYLHHRISGAKRDTRVMQFNLTHKVVDDPDYDLHMVIGFNGITCLNDAPDRYLREREISASIKEIMKEHAEFVKSAVLKTWKYQYVKTYLMPTWMRNEKNQRYRAYVWHLVASHR